MIILVHSLLVEAYTAISGHFLWAEMEIILFIHFYAHGWSVRNILDKIIKWDFLRTSNEVIWLHTLARTDLLCMLNWGTQWTMVSYLKK